MRKNEWHDLRERMIPLNQLQLPDLIMTKRGVPYRALTSYVVHDVGWAAVGRISVRKARDQGGAVTIRPEWMRFDIDPKRNIDPVSYHVAAITWLVQVADAHEVWLCNNSSSVLEPEATAWQVLAEAGVVQEIEPFEQTNKTVSGVGVYSGIYAAFPGVLHPVIAHTRQPEAYIDKFGAISRV